jgi:hypothetical protein
MLQVVVIGIGLTLLQVISGADFVCSHCALRGAPTRIDRFSVGRGGGR